jgi:N-acetylglucosamine-6-phosphate deacetylase
MPTVLINGTVYAEQETFSPGYVLLDGSTILDVGPMSKCPTFPHTNVIELSPTDCVVPGFIDLHIHGAAGSDTMDGTEEALRTITTTLPQEGTTSFLTTTITAPKKSIEHAVRNVARYIKTSNPPGEAEILGIHLEGPFISTNRAGAQPTPYIIEPDITLFDQWQRAAHGFIRLVTLAPELPGGIEFVKHLKIQGVVASIGHSDAVYEEVIQAIQAGATHGTHLFNGMRGIHHREPGAVGALLMHDEIKTEIIVDGIHVSPEMVRFAYRNKGTEGIILITDAMRAKCMPPGVYELGGQKVSVNESKAVLADGTLAGSMLKMNEAIQNMQTYTQCTLRDIVQMASWNPASQLGMLDRKGSLKKGKDADIVVLSREGEVILTFCRGKIAYSKTNTIEIPPL